MKRALTTSCLALAFAATSLGFAPTASANIGNCNTWITYSSPNYGNAYCSNLAIFDKFRVRLTCIDPHGKQWIVLGPWKKNTQTSREKCSTSTNVGVLKVGVVFSA
ncbi:hypothetical protein [Streptomyces sp. NBC_01217]|uniref:hypothetical protein n=1 Tax=Streptomyces sp. NBC_01217 TaxID=2903779 RepID=UPI002E0E9343|nr:hypothetical protein OG507_25265 [Streptomyces sp. NBC_01217]